MTRPGTPFLSIAGERSKPWSIGFPVEASRNLCAFDVSTLTRVGLSKALRPSEVAVPSILRSDLVLGPAGAPLRNGRLVERQAVWLLSMPLKSRCCRRDVPNTDQSLRAVGLTCVYLIPWIWL